MKYILFKYHMIKQPLFTFTLGVLFFFSSIVPAFPAQEARYYTKLPTGEINCLLCPRNCILKEGQTGNCTVRKNENGKLVSLVYAQLCAIHTDPIEKKPLFHFLPGTQTFSLATVGCNLRCIFCQNWNISQAQPGDVDAVTLLPEQAVQRVIQEKCVSISFTYSEPTVFYEYMFDTAALARQRGIRNVWVTSGYINQDPLSQLCAVIDAANVDLKGFSDKAYRQMAAATLSPVLETLKTLKKNNVWLEVGYLVIPTVNDSPEELRSMITWVVQNLGKDVPVHFLRFFPQHKLTNLPPTPVETLEKACKTAKEAGIHYAYVGNVPGSKYENTFCPQCKKLVIGRRGYFLTEMNIKDGRCIYCGAKIAGVWR